MGDDTIPVVEKPKKIKKRSKKRIKPTFVLGLIALIALSGMVFFYMRDRDARSNPAQQIANKNASETRRVLDALGRVFLIDTSTTPTVARVENPDTLRENNKEFYRDVLVGDYLVLFPDRAIIFRESENKVINVAPIVKSSDLQNSGGTQPASD